MGNYKRDEKSGSRGDFGRRNSGGRSGAKKEMHDAVCDSCGRDCKIPFKPSDGRPVYCSDCFETKNEGSSTSKKHRDRGPRRSNFERRSESRPRNNEQLEEVNRKLDTILEKLTTLSLTDEKETITKPIEVIIVDQKKTKSSKKKPTTKKAKKK